MGNPFTGHLVVTDSLGNRILDVNPATKTYVPLASIANPDALALSADGKTLYVTQFSFDSESTKLIGWFLGFHVPAQFSRSVRVLAPLPAPHALHAWKNSLPPADSPKSSGR